MSRKYEQSIRLVEIKHTGLWFVAMIADRGLDDRNAYPMNADNLRIRIRNLKAGGFNTDTDEAILAALEQRIAEAGDGDEPRPPVMVD